MAFIYGKEYTRPELLARVGNISQIAYVKPHRGTSRHIEPGEKTDYHIETGVLNGAKQMEELTNRCEGAVKDAMDVRNIA